MIKKIKLYLDKPYVKILLLVLLVFIMVLCIEAHRILSYNKVCNMLYIYNKNKKYQIINKIFSKKFCVNIIDEAENYASKYKWKTDRHKYYPTVDNLIVKEMLMYDPIMEIIKTIIFNKIAELYDINPFYLGINEVFIVKYSIGGQTSLDFHRDGSEFSFVIALNDDFEGGGTRFKYNNKTVNLNTGDCLIFSGQNEHQGLEITSGKRYILAGFLHYGEEKYCEKYLTNISKNTNIN
jgi:hypothetical protein